MNRFNETEKHVIFMLWKAGHDVPELLEKIRHEQNSFSLMCEVAFRESFKNFINLNVWATLWKEMK